MNYTELYLTLPTGWHTAKELGLAAATLNAMEKRGLVNVDRSKKPMLYSIAVKDNMKDIVLKALNKQVDINDTDTAINICTKNHDVLCIKRSGSWFRSWDGQEVTDRFFENVSHIFLYRNGFPEELILTE